ncbi:MAG: hypothetical protein KDD48_04655 [Bdellovibrionales bacterium]|nr:hypothetical protein [Bdellovibrionales bacterium]
MKRIVILVILTLISFGPGKSQAREQPPVDLILASEGAYFVYAIITGVTVLGVSYYASEAAPSLDGISIRFPKISGQTADLNSFKTVTDREIAIKTKLQAIVAEYRSLREEIENAFSAYGSSATIKTSSLMNFRTNVLKACTIFSEIHCGVEKPRDVLLGDFSIVYANRFDVNNLNGTLAREYTKSVPSAMRQGCNPQDVFEHFSDLGYEVRKPRQRIESTATMNGAGLRAADLAPRKSTTEIWDLYKNGEAACNIHVNKINMSDGNFAWQFVLNNPQAGIAFMNGSPEFMTAMMKFFSGDPAAKDPTAIQYDQDDCNDMMDGDPCKKLLEFYFNGTLF